MVSYCLEFRIRQIKSIYPPLWEQTIINKDSVENENGKDRVYNAYRIPLMVEKNVSLSEGDQEYKDVSDNTIINT